MLEAMAEAGDDAEEHGDVEVEAEGRRRNLSWNDALKQVPPDIRKLMKSMQADYTKKTQELSDQRKEFLREREALLRGQEQLKVPETLPDYDPFNESTIAARIEAEVNRRLNAVLEPMKREYETMAAEDAYQSFLSQHPDFKSDIALRSEVQLLLENNSNLDLETAYYAAKGKAAKLASQREADAAKAKRAAEREAATKGTGLPRKGAGAAPPSKASVKNMSAADLLAMAQAMHRNR